MSDIKLFQINGSVKEIATQNIAFERELQNIIEKNMIEFFGVKFLRSEYVVDNGRMDSIGIDENNCPVIFEYKRSQNENVINQGLFYLDWLLEHKDSFKLLVLEKLDHKIAQIIDWSMPRVICIAGDFNKYDESAIKQMNRNIALIRYKKYGDNLLMFEQVNTNIVKPIFSFDDVGKVKNKSSDKNFDILYNEADSNIKEMYDELRLYILELGDDVTENKLKLYTAFKKIKNIVCIEIMKNKVLVNLRLDVSTVAYEDGFSRDTSNTGHLGTGDVQLYIINKNDLEKAKPLIARAYEEN